MKGHLPNPGKYTQGFYIPVNPDKYVGQLPIRCLSSWEVKVCKMFDLNPNILQWSSESVPIKYIHPFKTLQQGKDVIATYYPDYTIIYIDNNGKQHKEIIEVKPKAQTFMEAARTKKEKADVVLNTAKWAAARRLAASAGYKFRVITENDIFGGKK